MKKSRLQQAYEEYRGQVRRRIVEAPGSPTGYGVLDTVGKFTHSLFLDTHRGPGFKISPDGKVFCDRG
jgi:hypothetical protein